MLLMSTPASSTTAPFLKRKRNYLWALLGFGLLHGVLYSYGLSHPSTQMGLQLFITFTLNLALLGWCYADSEERKIPITRWLGLALLAVSIVGVPWYFVRSRGFLGALKTAFGLWLILTWWVCATIVLAICEGITG